MRGLRLDGLDQESSVIESIKLVGAVCAIILIGALVGGEATWMYVRVSTLEQAMVTEHVGREKLVRDINETILPNIKAEMDHLKAAAVKGTK